MNPNTRQAMKASVCRWSGTLMISSPKKAKSTVHDRTTRPMPR
jgi:hypothetical protein